MYKEIFQKLNFFLFLALLIVGIVIESTIFSYFPINFIQPDLFLIMVIYLGFKRDLLEGGLLIILGSLLIEAHSGGGKYFMMTVYLYSYLLSKMLSRTVVDPDFFSSIAIVIGLTIVKKAGLLILLAIRGKAENGFHQFLIYLIPGILIQALLTPFLFTCFEKLDLMTFKDKRSDDEYDLRV